MNETLKVIADRRSIRKYKPDQITDEELKHIIDAAIYAPSARNQQKWYFTVIQNKDLIDRMARIIQENAINTGDEFLVRFMSAPGYHVFFNAPTVIVISCDKEANFVEMDCGMAAQNILLAAQSLGIGSCTIGFSRFLLASREGTELLEGLGIPEGYGHLCSISLGYPEGPLPAMRPRNREVLNYIK